MYCPYFFTLEILHPQVYISTLSAWSYHIFLYAVISSIILSTCL